MNDTATPLVSVVIPTYNHGRYLGRALQSLLNQSYTNWEAFVIDNHSTDNTDDVMATFVDARINYLKIYNKAIIAASRNAGIRAGKGEWIAFLDSDDWWTPDKLQTCFEYINDQVDFVYHDMEIVTEKFRLFRKKIKSWQVKSPVLIDLMARGSAIATSSVVIRTKLLTQLDGMKEHPDIVGAEDYNTWLRVAQLTDGFIYVSKRLGFYQLHSQGISQKNMSAPANHAVAEFIGLLNPQQKNKFVAHLKYTNGRFNYLAGNTDIAKQNLLFSMKHGQLSVKLKSALMLICSLARL